MAETKATGPWLGANLDRYSDTALHELGSIVNGVNGRKYRYVKFLDAVTYAAGHVCTYGTTTAVDQWTVTNDRVGGSSLGAAVAGVLHGTNAVPTQNQYGWIQVAGECVPLGTYAADDTVIAHATVDGTAVIDAYSAAKASFAPFGYAKTSAIVQIRGVE